MKLYSTLELSKILDITPATLRTYMAYSNQALRYTPCKVSNVPLNTLQGTPSNAVSENAWV
jgi:hypothetical protein